MKKSNTKTKRVLAIFLAVMMCLSMLNLTAFAEEGQTTEPAGEVHTHNTINCGHCEGKGYIPGEVEDCPDCDGGLEVPECTACDGKGTIKQCVDFDWDTPCPNHGEACSGCADCNHGYAKVYKDVSCETCNGTGLDTSQEPTVCPTCGGTGNVTPRVDCPDCEGGQVPCTGEFDAGVLQNPDGTLLHTCPVCQATYTSTMPEEQVAAVIAQNVTITRVTVSPSAPANGTVQIKVTVYNGNQFEVGDLALTFGFEGLIGTTEETVNAAQGSSTHEFTATVPAEAVRGTAYHVAVNGAYREAAIPNESGSAEGQVVREYQNNLHITVYAANMGRWYGKDSGTTAKNNNSPGVLSNLEGKKADFATLVNPDTRYWDEYTTNEASSKTWQCVGFIAIKSGTYVDPDKLTDYVYGPKFRDTSLSQAQATVTLPYGAAFTDELLKEWDENSITGLIAVWYVQDVLSDIEPTTDEPVPTIKPVAPPEAKNDGKNSPGVFVKCTNIDQMEYDQKAGTWTADILITITEDAPEEVHVNIDPALTEVSDKISKDPNGFQPGDKIVLNIKVDNQSGRAYTYNNKSAFVATLPGLPFSEGEESAGAGFDGNLIPAVGNDKYSWVARRILNNPLKDLLGADAQTLTNEAIGEKLKELGYGAEGDDASTVAQTYLSNYYLDWLNAVRISKGLAKAQSFQELDAKELAVLTGGDEKTRAPETCKSVVNALYYFFYGRLLTYNGVSIYDHMALHNTEEGDKDVETGIVNALAGKTYELIAAFVDGELTNNAFQKTHFGFRLGFDITAVPENTPTPPSVIITPTPTPTATPTPTPESTEEPSPTPEPTDEPIEDPDVPLGTPKPTEEPTPGPSATPDPGDEPIEDPDVPLGTPKPAPTANPTPVPDEEIPDEDVPKGNVPKTGDDSAVWFLLTLVSGAGLVFLGAGQWRKRKGA